MPIAVTEEHEDLRRTGAALGETHCPPGCRGAGRDGGRRPGELPAVWKELADQGWLGLHVAEAHGGQGFALVELAVVLEELGRALVPGPVLPTCWCPPSLARRRRPGDRAAAGARPGRRVHAGRRAPRRRRRIAVAAGDDGVWSSGAPCARCSARPPRAWSCPATARRGGRAAGACSTRRATGSPSRRCPALDPTRPLGAAHRGGGGGAACPGAAGWLRDDDVRGLALVAGRGRGAGGRRWCLETASEYAKVRVQFGRPIGQFQAIKHKLADMLVVVEQTTPWPGTPPGPGPTAAGR